MSDETSNKPWLVRTDFSGDAMWNNVTAQVLAPQLELEQEFFAEVECISNGKFEGLDPEAVVHLLPDSYNCFFVWWLIGTPSKPLSYRSSSSVLQPLTTPPQISDGIRGKYRRRKLSPSEPYRKQSKASRTTYRWRIWISTISFALSKVMVSSGGSRSRDSEWNWDQFSFL